MGLTGTETFNGEELSKYLSQLDSLSSEISSSIVEVDTEINKVLQTQGEDSGLYGTAASNLVTVWDDNSEIYTKIGPMLSEWTKALYEICGIKQEVTDEVNLEYQQGGNQ